MTRLPGAQLPPEVGNQAGGFRFSGLAASGLRLEVWGYWGADVIAAFARDALGATRALGAATVFTLDASGLKPQGAEGQDALRVLFRALAQAPFAKGTLISKNALTTMQMTRLLREAGLDGRMSFGDG
jgi:hypothetical protein